MNRGFVAITTALLVSGSAGAQEALLRKAAELDAAHQCAAAEQIYLQAEGGAPSQALLNNLGVHYVACEDPVKAAATFSRLLRLNPAHINGNLQMAKLAAAQGDGARALLYLSHAAASRDPEAALVRAEALQQTGKSAAAAAIVAELLRSTPGDEKGAPLLFAIGLAAGRMKLYDSAESAFAALLPLAPGDVDVLFNFGVAAARAGHGGRAKRALESALRIRPADADTLYELGRLEQSQQHYDRAVFLLAQARNTAPGRPDITLALARASQMAGYYGDALLAYDEYVALRPADELVQRDRALLRGYNRDTMKEGLRELQAYVAAHPNDSVGFYDLAQVLERSDRTKALDAVTTAIRLDTAFEPARYFRAWLLAKLDRPEEAIAEGRAALRLNARDVKALDLTGLTLLNVERPAEAERLLRAASALAPGEPEVAFHLARALIDLGRRQEAKPFLDRFANLKRLGTHSPREGAGVLEAVGLTPGERRKRGIEQLRRSVESAPGELSLRADLGAALLDAGETEEGKAVFTELLAQKPPAALLQRAGAVLLGFELYAMAGKFLELAVREKPDAAVDLAISRFYAEGPAEALRALDGAAGCGEDADCLLMKALILEAAGQRAEASGAVRSGLRYSVGRPRLAADEAVALLRRGENGLALQLANGALGRFPDDPGLALVRVAALLLGGPAAQAAGAARDLEKRWPEWDGAYLMEGILLERQGKVNEAKRKVAIAVAIRGAEEAVARCVQGRMSGEAGAAKCACPAEVFGLFFGECAGAR